MEIGSSLGQGFESQTFQLNFKPLKLLELLITHGGIYIHVKLYSGHKNSKNMDSFSEGSRPLCYLGNYS